jgi:hypothetical protein
MSHRFYESIGPFVSLEPRQQGYYMVEILQNQDHGNYTYYVYHAKTKDGDFELLNPTPSHLFCADDKSYFKLELNADKLSKVFLQKLGQQLVRLKNEKRFEYSPEKKGFIRSTTDVENPEEISLKNMFFDKVRTLTPEMRDNFMMNRIILDDTLFQKYESHFDRTLIYGFWKEMCLNHLNESTQEALTESWLKLEASQNHHFLIEFLLKIYTLIAKFAGYEVYNIHSLKEDLAKSDNVIHKQLRPA